MTNLRLGFALLVSLFVLAFAQSAAAQSTVLVVLTPDSVTGEVTFHVNTATNDARLTDVCVYRIDINSPDPSTPIACSTPSGGRVPTLTEQAPSGEGVVLDISVVIPILPEDQVFGAKNIATVAGETIPSVFSSNSAVLPFGVVAPLFVVLGSGI